MGCAECGWMDTHYTLDTCGVHWGSEGPLCKHATIHRYWWVGCMAIGHRTMSTCKSVYFIIAWARCGKNFWQSRLQCVCNVIPFGIHQHFRLDCWLLKSYSINQIYLINVIEGSIYVNELYAQLIGTLAGCRLIF